MVKPLEIDRKKCRGDHTDAQSTRQNQQQVIPAEPTPRVEVNN